MEIIRDWPGPIRRVKPEPLATGTSGEIRGDGEGPNPPAAFIPSTTFWTAPASAAGSVGSTTPAEGILPAFATA